MAPAATNISTLSELVGYLGSYDSLTVGVMVMTVGPLLTPVTSDAGLQQVK